MTMLRLGFAALFAALAGGTIPALAAPPAPGTTHTFFDPIFRGTIFCDRMEEVRAIAEADEPDYIYGGLRASLNEQNEPVCMAIVPTAVVVEVIPLGVMERDGKHYNAWAVETDVNGVTAFALYLERYEYVAA
jgi:hypothetical protein